MAALNYAQAGVSLKDSDLLVEKIAKIAKRTLNRKVKASIGGYASLYEIDRKRWLAASTDGVGTKLKLAFHLGEHRTIGIDLVAMSINDILCVGARPLFFLDYFATGKLEVGVAERVLEGIAEGCRQSGCALVGGETAEMPEFYQPGEYDLGGFAVGEVNPSSVLPRKDIRPGDALIGVRSSGCHSNGFSLLRALLPPGSEGMDLARELLVPTRIYFSSLFPLIERKWLKGLAHITGSGFLNVPRMSEKVSYEIALPPGSELPPIYGWVQDRSGLPIVELAQTFNLGIGMVAVVAANDSNKVLKTLKKSGEKAWEIGRVIRRRPGRKSEVFLSTESGEALLEY